MTICNEQHGKKSQIVIVPQGGSGCGWLTICSGLFNEEVGGIYKYIHKDWEHDDKGASLTVHRT